MAELIDRAAAMKCLEEPDALMKRRAETEDKEFVKVQVGITLASCEIEALPTIEPPVVHARWIERRKCYPTCSLCGRANRDKFQSAPYCHCGAQMDADAPERGREDKHE